MRPRSRTRIVWMIDHPGERARFAAAAAAAGRQFGIDAFVRKMERLYTLLHAVSRPTKRRGILEQDLSFLSDRSRRVMPPVGSSGRRARRARRT